ncbi:MAG TPA: peptide-methionine (S)-S-oxide reductase MsrA [Candidatus Eisenbacteria bacterium]
MNRNSIVPAIAALVVLMGCGGAPKSQAQSDPKDVPLAADSTAPSGRGVMQSLDGTEEAISLAPETDGAVGVPDLAPAPASKHPGMAMLPPAKKNEEIAIFAGGCFWCMEKPFEKIKGVTSVISGYTGGHTLDPSYDLVNTHTTGHVEAVRVAFDTTVVSYARLLDFYWHNVDPTTEDRQFCDAGDSYVSRIYWRTDSQRAAAEASRIKVARWLKTPEPIVTAILPARTFWPAEEYHQDYYRKNPVEYEAYRLACRRDQRLKQLWGDAAKH